MLFKNKSAEFPLLKTILILLTSSFILISFLVILIPAKDFTIDEKKINTQLVIKKLFYSKCFSENFGEIKVDKFNQENFDKCLKGLNSEKVAVKAYLQKKKIIIFNVDEDVFNNKRSVCKLGIKKNILCSEIRFPIILNENEEISGVDVLVLQILSST